MLNDWNIKYAKCLLYLQGSGWGVVYVPFKKMKGITLLHIRNEEFPTSQEDVEHFRGFQFRWHWNVLQDFHFSWHWNVLQGFCLAVPSTHGLSSFFGLYHYKCKSELRETARLWWSAGRLVASLGRHRRWIWLHYPVGMTNVFHSGCPFFLERERELECDPSCDPFLDRVCMVRGCLLSVGRRMGEWRENEETWHRAHLTSGFRTIWQNLSRSPFIMAFCLWLAKSDSGYEETGDLR